MRLHRFLAALFALGLPLCAQAQIISMKQVDGKQVTCMHSGLFSDLSDCGTRSDWYAFIFVGQVASITPIESDEKRIEIIPEEVFSGKPDSPTTIVTSQALCLRPIAVGDRWLFYLRKEKGKPITLDYYGNNSLPVDQAREQIETLRRLSSIGNFAILRGTVKRGDTFSAEPLPLAQVLATLKTDDRRFVAIADKNGKYQFQPLPAGDYNITITPIDSYQPDDSSIELKRGSCWDLTLDRSPHARVSGQVKYSDGSPAPGIDVVLASADNDWYRTIQTDEGGHFSFESQSPGKLVVGVNYPPRSDWFNGSGAGSGVQIPLASIFYVQSPNRTGAQIINLETDQQLDSINFTLPTH